MLEIDPDNIRDLRQEKKVHIHLTSDSKYVKKPREKERKRVCVNCRAGKSKSLIRWKRLKGEKRRKKAEKANLIYN